MKLNGLFGLRFHEPESRYRDIANLHHESPEVRALAPLGNFETGHSL